MPIPAGDFARGDGGAFATSIPQVVPAIREWAKVCENRRQLRADFDDIYDYIARDNPRAAAQVLRSLDESIQLLADQAKLGKVFRHRRLRIRLLAHDEL